jgi:thiol-disulfide isomerase/thioredoxin
MIMKKTSVAISVFILAAAAACTSAPEGYVITGSLTGADTGKVILESNAEIIPFSDTVLLKGGRFTFKGTVTTPGNYSVYVDGVEGGAVELFLVNDKITVEGDIAALQDATVTGPPVVMDARRLRKLRDSIVLAARPEGMAGVIDELENPGTPAARKAELQAVYDRAMEKMTAAFDEAKKPYRAYVKEHPYSPLSVLFIAGTFSDYPVAELSAMIDSMKRQPALRDNRFLALLAEYAGNAQGIETGKVAPDFTQNTPDGTPLVFSSVYKQNKLTMVDFWASWCGPCRRFNPTLVKLYNKYHAKGFEIIGVSCDEDREEWLKAIAGDKLTWLQVSDLQKWNNAVARQFNIMAIPDNIFVNADGRILGKEVGEDELEEFIREHLETSAAL